MKPFLVFAWDVYYPQGGYNDLVSQHDTKEEAVAAGLAAVASDPQYCGGQLVHEGKILGVFGVEWPDEDDQEIYKETPSG